MQFGSVLVDGGEQRRIVRHPRHGRVHIGLVDRDLRRVDRLAGRHALVGRLAPGLRVHGLAFPECGERHAWNGGPAGQHAIYVAADPATGDREAELLPTRPITLARVEIEAGGAQPGDGDILQRVPDAKDTQQPPIEICALILWGLYEFELQRSLADMAQAGAAEIDARRRGQVAGDQGRVDRGIHVHGGLAAAVEV